LILKGLEYINENKVVLNVGERKPEPAARNMPPSQPQYHSQHQSQPVKEPVREPEMAVEESQETDTRKGPGGRLKDSIIRFWDGIIEATDEKIDDNSSN
jgi:hypothetical protein